MNSIYQELSKLPHNPHFLKRYCKFIETFHMSGSVSHHALPRALFPQYENLKHNPWNDSKLGFRHHYIAHWLLWKAFPNNVSMYKAFWGMTNKDGQKINSKTYSILREEHCKWNTETKSSKVTAINVITGESKQIDKEEFDSSDEWMSISTGKVTAINAITSESRQITKEEFDSSDEWVGVNHGKESISKTMSENRKNGTIPTWNKGVTGYSLNISEEGRKAIIEAGQKKPSPQTKKIMSESMSSLPRCTCIECKTEVAAHHLNRHLNGTKCSVS